MIKPQWFITCFVLVAWASLAADAKPALFEIGPHNLSALPGGKEADGIQGDYVIRNDKIIGVISGNQPRRKANMGTNWNAVTPGVLYDLTFVGENNDQLTVFAPSNQAGPITYCRIVKDGSDGEALFETVISAANNDGLYKRHTYRLQDGWQGLLITTTLKNESSETVSFDTVDRWKPLSDQKTIQGIRTGDAIDPMDKTGYAVAWVDTQEAKIPDNTVQLQPGETITYARFLAVGHSSLEAFGEVAARKGETETASGYILEETGEPISTARVKVYFGDKYLHAYPNEDGYVAARLPLGTYNVTIEDRGRDPEKTTLSVTSGYNGGDSVSLSPAAGVSLDIRDENRQSIPCKVQFFGMNGTETPNLGPPNRAHGCLEQYHSETGQFNVQLDPGEYRLIVTRGIEYAHLEREITIEKGQTVPVSGTLERVVDTAGWVSTDFHNHSTPSGDNTTGTADRVINLAAEHIEFAPTTEHNRLFDWRPYIRDLGLQKELNTVSGIELTGGGPHLNAFPFQPNPHRQDGGAPVWNPDPRISAITLRHHQGFMPERWVHLNHPDMVENFVDRNGDGRADGGYNGLAQLIDAAETWGPNTQDMNILTKAPFEIQERSDGSESVSYNRQFIWLQLLNQGDVYWNIAVSDAHSVHGNGAGGWRTYIPSSTDRPAEIDWKEIVRNAKAGRMHISNGPYLEVETGDGTMAGGLTRALGAIDLHIKVQTTDWIDIDRVQILVNGRQADDLNFTRQSHPDWFQDGIVKFDRTVNVPLSEDSHLIVVAYGENFDLKTGYGTSWQSEMNPCAYNNPIFVDVDGHGFQFNHDTLGYPIPTRLSLEKAKALLHSHSHE